MPPRTPPPQELLPLFDTYCEQVDAINKMYSVVEKVQGAPVAWVARQCKTPNARQAYVQALARHIPVHSFGNCLHTVNFPNGVRTSRTDAHMQLSRNGTVPMVDAPMEALVAQYKFYLAFETESCDDYVTEKFFRSLYAGSVPVVTGAPNVRRYAPSNTSYVDVRDFKGPRELAEYLRYLDQNDAEYRKYLQWKQARSISEEYRRVLESQDLPGTDFRGYSRSMSRIVCDLCHKLQQGTSHQARSVPRCESPSWDLNA